MTRKGYQPITFGETTINKLNPKNLLVKFKAQYKPPETEFASSVLKGKTTFSESPSAKQSLSMFEKARTSSGEYKVTHATPGKFKSSSEIGIGSSEHPGLYVTPEGSGSPYFLKVSHPSVSPRTTSFSVFPKLSRPSVIKFYLQSVTRSPTKVRTSMSRFNKWLTNQKPGSKAYITAKHELGGPEIEAVIRFGTTYKPRTTNYSFIQRIKGYRQYTTYKGRNIPIREFKITQSTGKTLLPKTFHSKGYYSYNPNVTNYSLISPMTYGLTTSLSPISYNKSSSYRYPSSSLSYTPKSYSSKPKVPSYSSSPKPKTTSYRTTPTSSKSYTPISSKTYTPTSDKSYQPTPPTYYASSKLTSYKPPYRSNIIPIKKKNFELKKIYLKPSAYKQRKFNIQEFKPQKVTL